MGNSKLNDFELFDSHFHIIDDRFPLIPNQGYLPDTFTSADYLRRMEGYALAGGAVVSGSFQGFDQTYLLDALNVLGPRFVGVTQLQASVSDEDLITLHRGGVRAVRFNVERGGSEGISHLDSMARRVHELLRWHVELYVDASTIDHALFTTLADLPAVSIDHLGLRRDGFKTLVRLVERGVRVKATGFGRVDFEVKDALRTLYAANPEALMFGTDLPSTRAPRPYEDGDVTLVVESLGEEGARRVLYANAVSFYNPKAT